MWPDWVSNLGPLALESDATNCAMRPGSAMGPGRYRSTLMMLVLKLGKYEEKACLTTLSLKFTMKETVNTQTSSLPNMHTCANIRQ